MQTNVKNIEWTVISDRESYRIEEIASLSLANLNVHNLVLFSKFWKSIHKFNGQIGKFSNKYLKVYF